MIFVRFTRREVALGPLPSVCVRCGRPAFTWRTQRLRPQRVELAALFYAAFPALLILCTFLLFTWHPGDDWILEMAIWFFLLATMLGNIFAPWYAALGLDVRLPFCEIHHLHWFKRTVYDLVSAGFMVSLLLACAVAPAKQRLLLSLMWLHALQWVLVKTIARHLAIQLNDLTDRHVTLRGIHVQFRDALYRMRHEAKAVAADASPPLAATPEASPGVPQP